MGSSASINKGQSGKHQNTSASKQYELELTSSDRCMIRQIIVSHCLFSTLGEEQREGCLSSFRKWVYKEGSYIYRQHDLPQSMFLIQAGSVSVEIDCSIVKSLGEREYFGHETVCFASPRSESIRVITTEARVFSLPGSVIIKAVKARMEHYREDISALFTRIHFFNYLNNKERKFLIENTQLFRLNIGEPLFEKQQHANSFYIVRKNTVIISIDGKKDIIMSQGDYFGQSAFLQLLGNGKKSQRMGRAYAGPQGCEVFAIGLASVRACLGSYIRSILFFNQEKWALFRDEHFNAFKGVDYNHLLQQFNVRQGRKYSVLAQKGSKTDYLFIPLEVEINKSRQLSIYGSELLSIDPNDRKIGYNVILTDDGYYAYAAIDDLNKVLAYSQASRPSCAETEFKISKQPLYLNMTLTTRNLTPKSKQLPSSANTIILVVKDTKFGNQYILKVYPKISYCRPATANHLSQIQRHKEKSAKIIHGSKQRQIALQLVRRQKEIVSNLCNESICGYYKSQQDSNNYYLYFQYILGTKLENLLAKFGKIPLKITKYVLASLSYSLQYLHSNSIVYRNLNPGDIIIKNNGKVMLLDFSCSKKLKDDRKTNTIIGTPFYMAPQIILQKPYSFNSDLWSLGIVLFEMITGKLPFAHSLTDPQAIFQSILSNSLPLNNITDRNTKEIIKKLLEKDPSKRMQKALDIRQMSFINDLQFQWDIFLKGEIAPPYFPPPQSLPYTLISNSELFDLETVQDWN